MFSLSTHLDTTLETKQRKHYIYALYYGSLFQPQDKKKGDCDFLSHNYDFFLDINSDLPEITLQLYIKKKDINSEF